MKARFYRRISLFGGLGINISNNGVGASVRTPFGSVGNRGVSVKTPIKGLSFRHSWQNTNTSVSSMSKSRVMLDAKEEAKLQAMRTLEIRKKAMDVFERTFSTVQSLGSSLVDDHQQVKAWNGVPIDYPSNTFNQVLSQMIQIVADGRFLLGELKALSDYSDQHGLGVGFRENDNFRAVKDTIHALVDEIEKYVNLFIDTKLKEDNDFLNKKLCKFTCSSCDQPIEVSIESQGVEFPCPTCGCNLTVQFSKIPIANESEIEEY